MVRFILHSVGSTGDIFPFLALGSYLAEAGHSVAFGFDPNWGPVTQGMGLEYASIGPRSEFPRVVELLRSMIDAQEPADQWRFFLESMAPSVPDMYSDLSAMCQGADCLIACPYTGVPQMVHEKTGIPLVTILPSDFAETNFQVRAVWTSSLNRFRKELGFKETPCPWGDGEGKRLLSLSSVSPTLTGKDVTQAPGFFFIHNRQSFQPDPEIDQFVREAGAPIVVSFGSMISNDPDAMLKLLLEAVEPTGRRLIIQQGWAFLGKSLGTLPHFARTVGHVPHEWLFPRASIVIHHGGAGTTAACLKWGIPSIVVPFTFDQTFWGARTLCFGSTSGILPFRDLSTEKLSGLIQSTLDNYSHYRSHALRGAAMINREPGVPEAARAITEALSQPSQVFNFLQSIMTWLF